MGSMYQGTCACGYSSGVLPEGCGMAGPAFCRSLARCEFCRAIVSIRSSSPRLRCPTCRRKVQIIATGPEIERLFNLDCPRCGSPMLMAEVGLWD
jgi:DNA-directed RNA polymerase subunit RPC12/RpoP